MRFRIGGIIKTPFNADIQHEKRMPLSYGLGISCEFSHYFSMVFDIYRTHWDRYILVYPYGEEWSPINRKLIEEADIKPTTQVRMGIEYLIENTKRKIPIRMGAFYDPEPAGGRPDDFYGVSFGSGIIYNEVFSLDFAYQFRLGRKKNAKVIEGKISPARLLSITFMPLSFVIYSECILQGSLFFLQSLTRIGP